MVATKAITNPEKVFLIFNSTLTQVNASKEDSELKEAK
jgi:hypothetical protein